MSSVIWEVCGAQMGSGSRRRVFAVRTTQHFGEFSVEKTGKNFISPRSGTLGRCPPHSGPDTGGRERGRF